MPEGMGHEKQLVTKSRKPDEVQCQLNLSKACNHNSRTYTRRNASRMKCYLNGDMVKNPGNLLPRISLVRH